MITNDIAEPGGVTVYGHTKVVYTWPLLLAGLLMVGIRLSVGGNQQQDIAHEWSLWVMAITMCLSITALTIDVTQGVMVASVIVLIPTLIATVLTWVFWFNPFEVAWNFLNVVGPFGLVLVWVMFLWFVDFIFSRLYQKFHFENGVIRHTVMFKDDIWGVESVTSMKDVPDILEVLLWGGSIIIDSGDATKGEKRLLNVFLHSSVMERIAPHLPKDRSGRS